MAEQAPVALAPVVMPAAEPEPPAPSEPPQAAAPEPPPAELPSQEAEPPLSPTEAHSEPEPGPEPPAAPRPEETPRGWRALPHALRRSFLAPVINRLDDGRWASERRLDRLEGVLHGRFDAQADAILRRADVLQDASARRVDLLQDALLRRIDAFESNDQRLHSEIAGRLDGLETQARADLAAGRETARRLEDQDAELGRLRAEVSALREQSDLLLRIIGPRFDELEIKVRPLVPFDEQSWAVRLADGYVLVPRGQPEFAVQVANAPSGGLEAGTRRVLQALIGPGMCVADVGANVGLLTLACARAAGDTGRVHAFEPEPGPRAQLEKMVRLNGLSAVEVHAEAAGRAPGRMTLHVSPIIGHSSLYELPAEETAGAKAIQVAVTTLDAAVAEPLDVVKIDVEGAELDVLAGMARHLKASRDIAIVAEFGPAHLARTGVAPEAWWRAFKDQGFLAYAIAEPSGACAPAALRTLMKSPSTNLVFVRRGGAAERRLPRG